MSCPDSYLTCLHNQAIVIGTKHHKESVIAPILESTLGLRPFTPANFDSDVFGTFSGEIPRTNSPIDTLRQKCLAAMTLSGCPFGIASEGSFGPHPSLPFIPADDELLIFIDQHRGYELIAREISTDTNFKARTISSWADLAAFAEWVGFPSHGILLRAGNRLLNNVGSMDDLREAYSVLRDSNTPISAETDMRAMRNPRRMNIIRQATEKLVGQILSLCPDCGAPGFVARIREPGLPCGQCGLPTQSALRAIKTCIACSARDILDYPEGKLQEDPGRCDWCNP